MRIELTMLASPITCSTEIRAWSGPTSSRNGAPSDGLVSATNTMSFSVYSPLAATGVALDGRTVAGKDVTTTSANEAG